MFLFILLYCHTHTKKRDKMQNPPEEDLDKEEIKNWRVTCYAALILLVTFMLVKIFLFLIDLEPIKRDCPQDRICHLPLG